MFFEKIDKHIAILKLPSFISFPPDFMELRDRFSEICRDIEMDEEIYVVIITASESMKDNGSKTLKEHTFLFEDFPIERIRFSQSILEMDRPTIAAIPEDAKGLGLEIVLACDIRIGTPESLFSFPHIEEGLIPWDGGTQRLPRIIGRARALEMMLTGKVLSGKEAYDIGLLNRIVPRERLMDEAINMARDLASKAPHALRFIREAIYKGTEMPLEQALKMEGDLYLLLFTTEDRTEGIKAFREKRKPTFKGK